MGLLIKNLVDTSVWYDSFFIVINSVVIIYWFKQYIRARKFAIKNFLDDGKGIFIPSFLLYSKKYNDIENNKKIKTFDFDENTGCFIEALETPTEQKAPSKIEL